MPLVVDVVTPIKKEHIYNTIRIHVPKQKNCFMENFKGLNN